MDKSDGVGGKKKSHKVEKSSNIESDGKVHKGKVRLSLGLRSYC